VEYKLKQGDRPWDSAREGNQSKGDRNHGHDPFPYLCNGSGHDHRYGRLLQEAHELGGDEIPDTGEGCRSGSRSTCALVPHVDDVTPDGGDRLGVAEQQGHDEPRPAAAQNHPVERGMLNVTFGDQCGDIRTDPSCAASRPQVIAPLLLKTGCFSLFGMELKPLSHCCDERHQSCNFGISWSRWRTVPTRITCTFGPSPIVLE
jgi:hypothetical protein